MLSCVMSSTEDGVGLYRTSHITYRLQTPDTPPVHVGVNNTDAVRLKPLRSCMIWL
jgi:hypothetical protein